jgi:hypothetical protein
VSATLDTPAAAGETVAVADEDGTVVAAYVVARDTASLVVSVPELTDGASYDVYVGGSRGEPGVTSLGSTAGLEEVATVTEGEHTGGFGGPGGGRPPGGQPPVGEPPSGDLPAR